MSVEEWTVRPFPNTLLPTSTQTEIKPVKKSELIKQPILKRVPIFYHICRKCTVCLNEFKNCQLLRRLPCLHAFHRKCIDNWLKESSQCPVCMKDIKEHTVPSTS